MRISDYLKELYEDRKKLRNNYHKITEHKAFSDEYVKEITESRIRLYRELVHPIRLFTVLCCSFFYLFICILVCFKNIRR